jgi:HEAT repeat protein
MQHNVTVIIVITALALIMLLIVALLLASVVRRGSNARKHRKLDALRTACRDRVQQAIGSGGLAVHEEWFRAKPGSLEWQAVEEVLLDQIAKNRYADEVKALFHRLGYVAFYESRLLRRNVLVRASSIDKLGRMGCPSSTPKLLPLLDNSNPEILSVTVRALSRLGARDGLTAIVGKLPVLLGRSLVTRKTMETALLNFGEEAIPYLIAYQEERNDAWIISCILDTLSHLPPDTRSVRYAIEYLESPNPEVRSKALKVLGRNGQPGTSHLLGLILPLLGDPVWFVRLQAIKSAKDLENGKAAGPIGKLLFDNHWQVRSETAMTLTRFGSPAIDVFLDALMTDDVYAKESICEEIEKTGFVDLLIDHLDGADAAYRAKAREILRIMHSLRFSTPLREYLETGGNDRIRQEVKILLTAGAER